MTTSGFSYTGALSLEVMGEARNYNRFLESELVRFIDGAPRALDFGAGIGEFAQRLATRRIQVDCVELDQRQRAHLQTLGHEAFATLDETPAVYHRIYTLNTLEHIEDDAAALRGLRDKLAPGGRLFIYVPAFLVLYTEHDRLIGHFRRYHRGELRRKLEQTGFRVERLEYVDSAGFFAWMLLKWLPGDKTSINPSMVKLYDRAFFPASRLGDLALKRLLGKNLLAVAARKE